MQKLITSQAIYKQRLATCHACPHYVEATRSCGPLILGKHVTEDGHTFKLCGCLIDAKAAIAVQHCPGGKWGNELTLDEKREMLAYLDTVWGHGQLTDKDRAVLQTYITKLVGAPSEQLKKVCRSCGGAITEWINDTRQALKKSIGDNAISPAVESPSILESTENEKTDLPLTNETVPYPPLPVPQPINSGAGNGSHRHGKNRKNRR